MALKAKALVATTSDPRYQGTIHKWLVSKKLYDDHVRVSLAGCVKDREALMKNVRFAVKNFGVKQIFLLNSEGDLAYADRKFSDSTMEKEAHQNDLRNTKAALRAELPKLDVHPFFISKKQKIEEIPDL